jgi:hypothetical protein
MAETIWREVVEGDMQRHVLNPQLNALRTAALGSGQADPLEGALADAVADVRVAIESCARNRVSSTAGTVPPEWVKWTCYLALAAMQTRLPSLKLSEDQRKQVERAEERLDLARGCKLAVTRPAEALEPQSVQGGGGAVVVAPDPEARAATRGLMDGL